MGPSLPSLANVTQRLERKCTTGAREDPGDPRLRTEIIPFVVEAHGAAGPEACRLMAMTKHQFGQLVLPCEDASSEQTFYSAWAFRISPALQRGTAQMIHNITLGNTVKSRRTKDVDIEPAASSSAAGDGDDDGQLESDSETEVEISGSEAEIELRAVEPEMERDSNKNSSDSSDSGDDSSAR